MCPGRLLVKIRSMCRRGGLRRLWLGLDFVCCTPTRLVVREWTCAWCGAAHAAPLTARPRTVWGQDSLGSKKRKQNQGGTLH